jgi:hypothetical protein
MMPRLLVLLTMLLAAGAQAGMLHERTDFSARVLSVTPVDRLVLSDFFLRWHEGEALGVTHQDRGQEPKTPSATVTLKGAFCAVKLQLTDSFFKRRPTVAYVRRANCKSVKRGEVRQVRYFGFAHEYRVVGLKLDDGWRHLPLMLLSADPWMHRCVGGALPDGATLGRDCARVMSAPALGSPPLAR